MEAGAGGLKARGRRAAPSQRDNARQKGGRNKKSPAKRGFLSERNVLLFRTARRAFAVVLGQVTFTDTH